MASGVFKRSSFTVDLISDEDKEQLLQLDVFAGGLAAYMGKTEDKSEDDEDVNGGMEMRVLGNSLRPFVFFQSTGDLMSIYWSGKASEMNSALQGTQLIQDSQNVLRLCNGAAVKSSTYGIVSYDFSGKVLYCRIKI